MYLVNIVNKYQFYFFSFLFYRLSCLKVNICITHGSVAFLLIIIILLLRISHSQKPSTSVFASACAILTIDGHVHKNVRRLHAGQKIARVRQFPDAYRTRGSARVGIRLFHYRPRRCEPRKV